MTPRDLLAVGLVPALSLLPARMDSLPARAMVLAILLQESELEHRRQVNGPARGFPQFELAGVHGVVTHPQTAALAREVCERLGYPVSVGVIHAAMEHNDPLACAFARLLLWTVPLRLPQPVEHDFAWKQYLSAWRPGRPHPDRWNERFARAWAEVSA